MRNDDALLFDALRFSAMMIAAVFDVSFSVLVAQFRFLTSFFSVAALACKGGPKVYDVTKYLDDHPGGAEVMLDAELPHCTRLGGVVFVDLDWMTYFRYALRQVAHRAWIKHNALATLRKDQRRSRDSVTLAPLLLLGRHNLINGEVRYPLPKESKTRNRLAVLKQIYHLRRLSHESKSPKQPVKTARTLIPTFSTNG